MLLMLLFTGGGRRVSVDYWLCRHFCQNRIPLANSPARLLKSTGRGQFWYFAQLWTQVGQSRKICVLNPFPTKITLTDTKETKAKADNSAENKPSNSSSRGERRGRGRGGRKRWSVDRLWNPRRARSATAWTATATDRGIQTAVFLLRTDPGTSLPHTLRSTIWLARPRPALVKLLILVSTISDLLKHPIEEGYRGETRALILAPPGSWQSRLAKMPNSWSSTLTWGSLPGWWHGLPGSCTSRKHCDIMVGTQGRLLVPITRTCTWTRWKYW